MDRWGAVSGGKLMCFTNPEIVCARLRPLSMHIGLQLSNLYHVEFSAPKCHLTCMLVL